jgi:hypothetical protein
MSRLAEKKATTAASVAIVQMSSCGRRRPSAGIDASSATCIANIQPRRRPSQGIA